MKKALSLVIAAAVIMIGLASVVGMSANAQPAVPAGYSPNDFLKLRAFLEIADENGVKNGDKIFSKFNTVYDPDDPRTWINSDEDHTELWDEILWTTGEDNLLYAKEIFIQNNELVGELDLSEFEYLSLLNISYNGITALNLNGATAIESLACDENPISSISWRNTAEDVEITLSAENGGYVNTFYEGKETFVNLPCAWYAKAWSETGVQFIGWHDADGNCVSTNEKYEICETWAGEDYANAPSGVHLNLTARFESTEQPTAAPTETPTEQPTAAPTENPTEQPTAEPTEAPEEPTQAPTEAPAEPTAASVEPTSAPTSAPGTDVPNPPNTGMIAASAAGIAAIAGGMFVGIRAVNRRRK